MEYPPAPLQLEGIATPDRTTLDLIDGNGRKVGTAVARDGRMTATITDPHVIEVLKRGHHNISIGHRVVVEPAPASRKVNRNQP